MKIKILPFVMLILLASSCVKEEINYVNDVQDDDIARLETDGFEVLEGVVRVKLAESVSDFTLGVGARGVVESGLSELDAMAVRFGASQVRRVFRDGGRFEQRRRDAGLHLWYDIYFDESNTVARAVRDFSGLPEVEIAEPVVLGKLAEHRGVYYSPYNTIINAQTLATTSFNDPELAKQWHYNNEGKAAKEVEGSDINLYEAWQIEVGKPDVVVAIIDGGIQIDHPDIKANLWVNQAELDGVNGVDDDGNGYIDDIHGFSFRNGNADISPHYHGTHVGGTVGAVNNNGVGVGGVAGGDGTPNSGARLMVCAVANTSDYGLYNFEEAFVYAADNGAVIAQCSFSATVYNQSYIDAFEYFIANAGIDENGVQTGPIKGGLIISAAGNNGNTSPTWPAYLPEAIAVAAIGPDYVKPGYSTYGDWVDISAPGGSVTELGKTYGVYSTSTGSGYDYLEGTSMACPHVSGVAALVISKFGGPGMTARDIKTIIVNSGRNIDEYNKSYVGMLGTGLLDAALALEDDPGLPCNPVTNVEANYDGKEFTITYTVPTDSKGRRASTILHYINFNPIDQATFDPANPPADIWVVRTDNRTDAGKTGTTTIKGYPGFTYYIATVAADKFGNPSTSAVFTEYYTPYFRTEEPVSVTDDLVPMPEPTVPRERKNTPPYVVKGFDDITFTAIGEAAAATININGKFGDADRDDILKYSATSSDPSFAVSVDTRILTLTPVDYGTATITVTATDRGGETVSSSFTATAVR